jgi:hypothetical protein
MLNISRLLYFWVINYVRFIKKVGQITYTSESCATTYQVYKQSMHLSVSESVAYTNELNVGKVCEKRGLAKVEIVTG